MAFWDSLFLLCLLAATKKPAEHVARAMILLCLHAASGPPHHTDRKCATTFWV